MGTGLRPTLWRSCRALANRKRLRILRRLIEHSPQTVAQVAAADVRGIEEVLNLHETNPPLEPEFGPGPDRSRKAYENEN